MNEAWLPKGVTMYSQLIFGSIGFATGSALGASVAGKEIGSPHKRLILTTGEGSLQLTIQTLSLIQRHGMSAIV
jgi:pyruvate decarboxylase